MHDLISSDLRVCIVRSLLKGIRIPSSIRDEKRKEESLVAPRFQHGLWKADNVLHQEITQEDHSCGEDADIYHLKIHLLFSEATQRRVTPNERSSVINVKYLYYKYHLLLKDGLRKTILKSSAVFLYVWEKVHSILLSSLWKGQCN